MPAPRITTIAELISMLQNVPQDDLIVLPSDPEGNEHRPLGPLDPSPYWYLPNQRQISATPARGAVRCRVLWPGYYPPDAFNAASTEQAIAPEPPQDPQDPQTDEFEQLEQLRAVRLDQMRDVAAALGLRIVRTPPEADCEQCAAGGHDEFAPLLGICLAVLDGFAGDELMLIATAYHEVIRNRESTPGIVEREQAWWHALHNRARLLYSLSKVPRPADAAPPSQAVTAADTLLRVTAKLVHAVTTIRLMLETPPDVIPGGPGRQHEIMSAATHTFINGLEAVQEPFETLAEQITPGGA